jgi:RNA polymerase sigma factor (sigma-70 family)
MQPSGLDFAISDDASLWQPIEEWSRPRYQQLLGTARRLLRPPLSNRHQPEDLVQEAIFKAIKSGFSIAGREEPEIRSYLLRSMLLVRKVWRRYHSQEKRSLVRECSLERIQENKSASICGDGIPISDQTSPSGRAIRNEQSTALHAALSQLPPQLRLVVQMRKLENMSVSEIAAALGLEQSEVSRLVYKGTKELIEKFKPGGRERR